MEKVNEKRKTPTKIEYPSVLSIMLHVEPEWCIMYMYLCRMNGAFKRFLYNIISNGVYKINTNLFPSFARNLK